MGGGLCEVLLDVGGEDMVGVVFIYIAENNDIGALLKTSFYYKWLQKATASLSDKICPQYT